MSVMIYDIIFVVVVDNAVMRRNKIIICKSSINITYKVEKIRPVTAVSSCKVTMITSIMVNNNNNHVIQNIICKRDYGYQRIDVNER